MAFIIPIIFIVLVNQCYSAEILAVFPLPSLSHQIAFRPLTRELARRGHNVTVLTPDPVFRNAQSPPNYTEIDVNEVSYKPLKQKFDQHFTGDPETSIDVLRFFWYLMNEVFEKQWTSDNTQKALRDKKFDLVLTEAVVLPTLAVAHHYKTPVVQISSFGAGSEVFSSHGAPTHPLLYPEVIRSKVYNLGLWDKIIALYEALNYKYLIWHMVKHQNDVVRKIFGGDTPSVTELARNVDLLLLNVHPIWDNNRPVPPTVVYMGGIHIEPPKELPTDLKSYLDNSKHGVIYMSFGNNVNTSALDTNKIQIFNKVFSKLPYDVIWKWDIEHLPGKSEKVKISKWLPQLDILRHPKVKLFISQGGLQSTDEAMAAGVPLLAFPMLGDQWYNADLYVKHKIGLQMRFSALSEDTLEKSIKTLIDDKSYRDNIRQLGLIVNDEPQHKLDRAIWWIEYVLRHGGTKHLRAPSVGVSWIEYLMLNVVGSLVLVLTAIIIFIRSLIRKLYVQFSKEKNEKKLN